MNYDIPKNWRETCDGQECKCGAYGEFECGCIDVDWTSREIYELRIENNELMEGKQ